MKLLAFTSLINLSSVFCYAENKDLSNRKGAAFVQKLDMATSEIIGHEDDVSVLIDCSAIELPKNTLFYGGRTDFGRVVNINSMEFLGLESAFKGKIDIQYQIDRK